MSKHAVGEYDAVLLARLEVRDRLARATRWEQHIVRDATHGSLARVHVRLQLSVEVVRLVASHVHPDACKRKAGQLT